MAMIMVIFLLKIQFCEVLILISKLVVDRLENHQECEVYAVTVVVRQNHQKRTV